MALGSIGPNAIPAITELLQDQHTWVRVTAALVLADAGRAANTASASLPNCSRIRTGAFRDAAALALGKIGPEAKFAVPRLTELLIDESVRETAAWALGEIGSAAKSATPALITLLKNEWVRQTAASSLGHIGPAAKAAIPALTELLEDPDKGLHKTAADALQKISTP